MGGESFSPRRGGHPWETFWKEVDLGSSTALYPSEMGGRIIVGTPHRGERISPRQNDHDERFASTKRRRPEVVLLLLYPVSDTPLRRFVRFAGTGLFLKSLTFQFFKDLPSKIVIFASPFLHLLPPTHTFFPDLPRDSSTFPCIFFHRIRGTSQGPSWATLGPSWGHLRSVLGPY